MKLSKEARAALAQIGSKGGKTNGSPKRRSKAHYERLAAMKRKPVKTPDDLAAAEVAATGRWHGHDPNEG